MNYRPGPVHVRNALARGVCPWCSHSTEGLESDFCPECGNNVKAPLGPRDPGSPGLARLCTFLALGLIIAVAVIQRNVGSPIASKPAAGAPMERASGQFEITAKVFVKMQTVYSEPQMKAELGKTAIKTLQGQAVGAVDEVRVAMLAGEMTSTDDAIARLDTIAAEPESELGKDCAVLRELYAGEPLNAEGQLRLETNHGWIGRLAATHGKPDSHPERAPLVSGGGMLLVLGVVGFGIVMMVMVAGFVLLIVALVRVTSGTLSPRFVPPSPGGSMAIEMVVVFVVGFLVLKGVTSIAEGALDPKAMLWFSLIAQWCLLFLLLWPRLRGVKGGLKALGWHKGRGVFTEIGCGIVGYLACLPLVVVGAIISVILMFLYQFIKQRFGGAPPPPAENPIFEIASGKGGGWIMVVIFLLASVWAPIMEETIFRGALYRHLRSRWTWFPAAAVSAIGFGLMHNYPVLMLGPVISLGFGFALLREWRGSLIASMTAHCMHNGAVLTMVMVGVYLIGG